MISAKLTGVMLAVVPPVSIGAVIYGRYLRKLSKQTQEALGEMSKVGPYATICWHSDGELTPTMIAYRLPKRNSTRSRPLPLSTLNRSKLDCLLKRSTTYFN
jgi:hypothetical protein